VNQIDQWAQELKGLRTGAAIKAFRQRFDKPTAQRIIRSAVLSDLDRAAISLTIQFAANSRWDLGDSVYLSIEDDGLASIDTLPAHQQQGHGGISRHSEHQAAAGDPGATAAAESNAG
jgi:hypothetical protein